MDLANLGRSCWVLIYRRDIVTAAVVSSISSDWICLFRTFADKVADATTIYTEVICLASPSFDLGQLS